MCGIFAYSGPHNVTEVLIKGLKKLEYRGYDSAGLAFFDSDHIQQYRVCGGVDELRKKIKGISHKNSLGIGHTRWATHGAPSEKNAHPHHFHSVYVVHNGVIENIEEIKPIIGIKTFLSDTDTEVIPRLIHHFCKTEKVDFLTSTFKSINLLKGSYAVVVIHEEQPGEIIAFKSGPPLVFCKTKNEIFISSDLQALDQPDIEMIFLEDEELLHIKDSQFQIFDFQGKKIIRQFKKHSQTQTENDKGHHPHFMIKEILEQPHILTHLIEQHVDKSKQNIVFQLSKGSIKEFDQILKDASELIILACGSSYYAALFAKYILEDIGKTRVHVEMASEFIYRKTFLHPGTPVLFVSQSGETADILVALKQTEQLGLKSISLCNVQTSSLNRKTDFAFSMEAGPEQAVASTKTFSASLTALSILGFHLAKIKGFLTKEAEQDFVQHLLELPSQMKKVLLCDQFFLEIMEKLKKFKTFFYLGRNLYYPMALEGALKLKEIAYLSAEAYPSGEMKHGPLAMIDKNMAIVALLPSQGVLYQKSLINLKEARSRGSHIISIGGKTEDSEFKKLSDEHLSLPSSHRILHPLLTLIPLQMMAYYTSRSYGYNADRPRNLAKSVTVE